MNGSAVALGLMQAPDEQHFPAPVDAWRARAQNHISPAAYNQNDIVKALDGTTIEVVHTDTEGRMVPADTPTMASREAPNLIVDVATLTGSMRDTLGAPYSGVFASEPELGQLAVAAGQSSSEGLCLADCEQALDSRAADVRQCTLEGDTDHILGARFLRRFTHDTAWLPVDLSASNSSSGLGAVGSDITGSGVAWCVELLARWLAKPAAAKARRRGA